MYGEIKSIAKVASMYVATIIGAGFASGQEIVQFFSTYYEGGFYGIVLAGILFALIGYIVLDKVYRERIKSYDEFLFPAVGWLMGWVINITSALFSLSVFSIMIAGASSVFQDKLNIPLNYGVFLMAFLCMLVILWDIRGIMVLSTVTTPVLIMGIVAVGLYILMCKDASVFSGPSFLAGFRYNWFSSALLYVGYNSIMSIVILCNMLPNLKSRRIGTIGGIVGGLVPCLIALMINTVMIIFAPDVLTSELPVLTITEKYGNFLSNAYAVLLWLAMFVSATTSGYCFIDRLSSKVNISRTLAVPIVCALVIPLASAGFSNLISAIYPIFGYLGFFLLTVTLIQGISFKPGSLVKKNK